MPQSVDLSRQQALAELGSHVRDLRNKSGLTKEDLAHQANVAESTIDHVERGIHLVSSRNLDKIIDALGGDKEMARQLRANVHKKSTDVRLGITGTPSGVAILGPEATATKPICRSPEPIPLAKDTVKARRRVAATTMAGLSAFALSFVAGEQPHSERLVYEHQTFTLVAGPCPNQSGAANNATRSVVDFDVPRSAQVEGPGGVNAFGKTHDLAYYIYCPNGRPLMLIYGGTATGVGDKPTPQHCRASIPDKPQKNLVPKPEMTICTKTNGGAIVVIHINFLANDGTSATISATLWR